MILLPVAVTMQYAQYSKKQKSQTHTIITQQQYTSKKYCIPLLLLDGGHIFVNMELCSYTSTREFTYYTVKQHFSV